MRERELLIGGSGVVTRLSNEKRRTSNMGDVTEYTSLKRENENFSWGVSGVFIILLNEKRRTSNMGYVTKFTSVK